MIHIELMPEPSNFDTDVRQPGNTFLSGCPNPSRKDWDKNRYWSKCSNSLYSLYNGICAYTGQWFSNSMSAVSVDHFYPKSIYQEKAYEWDNYRLTTQIMNNNKGDNIILDPCEIADGDIILDFPSCLVKPRSNMSAGEKNKTLFTIKTLKLNDEKQANRRCEIVMEYINRDISKRYLQNKYPFIAKELERQGLSDTVATLFKKP